MADRFTDNFFGQIPQAVPVIPKGTGVKEILAAIQSMAMPALNAPQKLWSGFFEGKTPLDPGEDPVARDYGPRGELAGTVLPAGYASHPTTGRIYAVNEETDRMSPLSSSAQLFTGSVLDPLRMAAVNAMRRMASRAPGDPTVLATGITPPIPKIKASSGYKSPQNVTGNPEFGILPPSSGGGAPLPSGALQQSAAPQPLLSYPPVPDPVMSHEAKSKILGLQRKQYPEGAFNKVWTGKGSNVETKGLKKAIDSAQRDIDAGQYTPYFDVAKRADVDPSKHPSGPKTVDVAMPKQAATIEKYTTLAQKKDAVRRLNEAYDMGLDIKDSENWYFVKQIEDGFIKYLGAKEGRKQFREKFAMAMAATTGGSSPKENFRTAMYGNYLRENNLPYPKTLQTTNWAKGAGPDDLVAYQMPSPVGGRYVSGNVQMHKRLMDMGIDPVENPKRYNFMRNFLGEKSGATIDEQMSGLWDPKLKQPPGRSYGIYEGTMASQAALRGVDPRGFQDVAWAGAKKIKEGDKYKGSKPMVQEVNESIERTARITGLTPEQVFVEGMVKSRIPILSVAGAAFIAGAVIDDTSDNERKAY